MTDYNKRVLIVTTRCPFSSFGGDKLRIQKIAEYLARFSSVDLIYTDYKIYDADCALYNCVNVYKNIYGFKLSRINSFFYALKSFVVGKSFQEKIYYSEEVENFIKKISSDYDAVVFHLVRTRGYLNNCGAEIYVEMTDAISMNYSVIRNRVTFSPVKLLYSMDAQRLLRLEREVISIARKVFVVSSVDQTYLCDATNSSNVVVAGNGVDQCDRDDIFDSRSFKVVLIANFGSVQNRDGASWFIENVLPRLNRDMLFELICIGPAPQSFVKKYRSRSVKFTGAVKDLYASIPNSLCGICPIRIGAGVQNKILNYFAAGLPVVSTSLSAQGLTLQDGEHCLVADDADDFAHAIFSIQQDYSLAQKLRDNSRNMMLEKFSWNSQLGPFDIIVNRSS